MRCPDCNTFVAYDTEQDPEEQGDEAIDGTTFTASARRVLTCEQCGTELKEATIEIEGDVTIDGGIDVDSEENQALDEPHEHEWDFDVTYSPAMDVVAGRWQTPAKRAATHKTEKRVRREGQEITTRKIKPGDVVWEAWGFRYHRTLYGVEVSGTATCVCGATAEITAEAYEAASGFDELV
jgi:uncharacterized protein YbaR (Trm112 family)